MLKQTLPLWATVWWSKRHVQALQGLVASQRFGQSSGAALRDQVPRVGRFHGWSRLERCGIILEPSRIGGSSDKGLSQ